MTLKKRIPEATTTREETSALFYSGDQLWLRSDVRRGKERATFSWTNGKDHTWWMMFHIQVHPHWLRWMEKRLEEWLLTIWKFVLTGVARRKTKGNPQEHEGIFLEMHDELLSSYVGLSGSKHVHRSIPGASWRNIGICTSPQLTCRYLVLNYFPYPWQILARTSTLFIGRLSNRTHFELG